MSETLDEVRSTEHGQPALFPESRLLHWSIRRELWENRFLYIAPLLVAGLVLFASSINVLTMASRTRSITDPAKLLAMALKPLLMAPAPIMLATFIIGMFYCLDALYGERRERSILFWKSLPVSDRTTVVSKMLIPLMVLPLIAFALSVITQTVLLVLSVPVMAGRGLAVWRELNYFQGIVIMFYGLAVHALWFTPIYGWLLLISAWAKRAAFLWVLLPVIAIALLERVTLQTTYFTNMLSYRFVGAMKEAFTFTSGQSGHVNELSQLELANYLTAPGLWTGLGFAAACLAAAIRLRRNREPI